MNQIEPIKKLPDWDWLDHSKHEIMLTGPELLDHTDFAWQIGNVAVIGFIYQSFLSPPWMWFALTKGITIGDLLDFRRSAWQIPLGTVTAVKSDYEIGLKFAKFYGFEDTGQVVEHLGNSYKLFRRV